MQIVFSNMVVVLYPGQTEATAANVLRIEFRAQPTDPTGLMVPMFTGAEAAEKFIITLGRDGEGMGLASFAEMKPLYDLLVALQKTGTTHVNFNADRYAPNPIPIAEVIRDLARHM
jgi:hypothetical protein